MAKLRKGANDKWKVDVKAADRMKLAELFGERMGELGLKDQELARSTSLAPVTIRTRYRAAGADTTFDLWGLVALCRGLDIEVGEMAELIGIKIADDVLEGILKGNRTRRVARGLPAEPLTPAAPRAPRGDGAPMLGGGSLRDVIEAIVDERIEARLADLLSA